MYILAAVSFDTLPPLLIFDRLISLQVFELVKTKADGG